jgi:imidazolonepropionase-like amidohydrolase
MVQLDSAGMRINWPGARDTREVFEQLNQWIAAAKRYDAVRHAAKDGAVSDVAIDPRYEALRPYVRGEKPFLIEADSQQHLTEALQWAEKEKLKIILCAAADAWKMTEAIKKANVPVIVGPTMHKPRDEFDPFDSPYANPGRLHDAGIKFAIRSNNAANSRNAPFEAGMAVAYGLPEDAALRSVTLSAAEILGIADQCGSITQGKRADLVILDGSPLQITSQVKGVIVGGKPYQPVSRQTQLYDKYRQRLQEVRAAK